MDEKNNEVKSVRIDARLPKLVYDKLTENKCVNIVQIGDKDLSDFVRKAVIDRMIKKGLLKDSL